MKINGIAHVAQQGEGLMNHEPVAPVIQVACAGRGNTLFHTENTEEAEDTERFYRAFSAADPRHGGLSGAKRSPFLSVFSSSSVTSVFKGDLSAARTLIAARGCEPRAGASGA
jgi:hypothetical protein